MRRRGPNRSPYRHASGFTAYVRATAEQPHPVPDFYVDGDTAYCARCSFPIVTPPVRQGADRGVRSEQNTRSLAK